MNTKLHAVADANGHPIGKIAAMFIFARVGEWREEFVQEIAVRGVDLDRVQADPGGAPCRIGKGIADIRPLRISNFGLILVRA
ncbi:hypothetical protein QE385_003229 [Sphingomonas sp. SORGH_AS 950]|nr:hypothetical protein [Sphingomonas sp. SORGH_AS_0950]